VESGGTRPTYPDSTYITYDYDELNRMTAVRNSSGMALASYRINERIPFYVNAVPKWMHLW
jgi:hypothetical protein